MDPNCSRCASPLPADARFCPACGEPVPGAAATDPARTARVAAAVPPSLAAKMRAPRLTGEWKPVTACSPTSSGPPASPRRWTRRTTRRLSIGDEADRVRTGLAAVG